MGIFNRKMFLGVGFTALTLISFAEPPCIMIPKSPTVVERKAAEELRDALKLITEKEYKIVNEGSDAAKKAEYAVGATSLSKRLAADSKWGECAYDEIRRGTVDGCTVLDGHHIRGAIYSVDSFLEDIASVRWWSSEESDYPKKPNWRPGKLEPYRYQPPFRFRETFYRSTLLDADFKVRHKVNTTSYTRFIIPPAEEAFIPEEKGGNHKLVFYKSRRSAYHSFFEVLPPKKYAKDHPDWYSEINGKRTGGGQLCVTNPEMQKEYIKNTLELLRQNPDCGSIQVSQNDTGEKTVCTCKSCLEFKEREGSWAGPYIEFANIVAEAIEKEFPNVFVDTFAYMFTRKAPNTVRPRKIVIVRLCNIECAFNRSLVDQTYSLNRSFSNDVKEWSKIASGQLYLWDYQANFTSYMLPHPNIHVFAENMKMFLDAGAIGVFEQGDSMCYAGDFCQLKCYVTSHLMWDPTKDLQKLIDEFLNGYYGPEAAPYLKKVLEITSASASRKGVKPMTCYHSEAFPWITPEVARESLSLMESALDAAKKSGSVYEKRVRRTKLAWDHAKIRSWKKWGFEGEPTQDIDAFCAALKEFNIDAYCETITRKTLDNYVKKLLSRKNGKKNPIKK